MSEEMYVGKIISVVMDEPTVEVTFTGTKTKVVRIASGGVAVIKDFQLFDKKVLTLSEVKELIQ